MIELRALNIHLLAGIRLWELTVTQLEVVGGLRNLIYFIGEQVLRAVLASWILLVLMLVLMLLLLLLKDVILLLLMLCRCNDGQDFSLLLRLHALIVVRRDST